MAIIPTNGEFSKVPEGGGSDNRFVVTLTPTAADFSGTMDKTPAEIDVAWNAGKRIFFTLRTTEITYTAPVMLRGNSTNLLVFYTYVMMGNNLVVISTGTSNSRYNVTRYPLSPLGS